MKDKLSSTASFIIGVSAVLLFTSGCIRLTGQAGYFKETPRERTEKVVGFDTAKVFEDGKPKGNITK